MNTRNHLPWARSSSDPAGDAIHQMAELPRRAILKLASLGALVIAASSLTFARWLG